jgi:hypothetical protein
MATLPSILNETDVGQLVKDQNERYQPQGPRIPGDPQRENLPSNATPAAMLILLDALVKYTEQVQSAAAKEGMNADVVMAQWQKDISNWVARLNHYREVTRSVSPEDANNLAGADAIYFTVTSPLLDGYWYEVLPGMNLSDEEKARMQQGPPNGVSNKKPPDVYVPFSLGNQVLIYQQHQRERWDQLWVDVWENTLALPGQAADKLKKAGWDFMPWLVAGGVAVVGGGVAYLLVQRWIVRSGTAAAMQRPPYQRPAVILPPGLPAESFR